MQLEIYQWLVPLVGIFYLVRMGIQSRNEKRSTGSLIIWSVFWIIIIIFALLPNPISFKIAELLGFKSDVNAIIFGALGLLFILVFYPSAALERQERKFTHMAREIALFMQKMGKGEDEHENGEQSSS